MKNNIYTAKIWIDRPEMNDAESGETEVIVTGKYYPGSGGYFNGLTGFGSPPEGPEFEIFSTKHGDIEIELTSDELDMAVESLFSELAES